jgi:hypothetical protein
MTRRVEMFRANPEHVKMLLDHLNEAHNSFCEAHPEIGVWDDFMAVHNFHTLFVLSLERDYRLDSEQQLFMRAMAMETFKVALENKPALSQGRKRGKPK